MRERKKSITRSEAADILKLKQAGLTRQAVARELNISDNRIKAVCEKFKIRNWPIGAASHNQCGAANPNYGGGNSRGTIARTTKRVLNEAGKNLFRCERCGNERAVEQPRHHKDRNRKNNSLENLEVLCVSCHNKEHMSEKVRLMSGQFA